APPRPLRTPPPRRAHPAANGRCTRSSSAASADSTTSTSGRCTPPMIRWPSTTPATSTPAATSQRAPGSPPPPLPRPRAPTTGPTGEEGRDMTTERPPAGSEPTINVEHDEAGTNVEHDTHDNAYSGLLVNDANWAFGTDFEDPLAGVDITVPDGVDAADLG